MAFVIPRSYGDVWDPFHSKEQMLNMWKSFADTHQIPYRSVGKTYEGNDILMFKLGNPNGGRVLWDAYLHGNEDYGAEILYMLLEWLFSGDPRAERILERNHILFIPVVNVDARHWAGTHERGNSHFYSESPRYGVDLNRNFRTGWRHQGLYSDTYSGPSPASEPETQVLRAVFDSYRPSFYVNLHSGAGPYAAYYRGGNTELTQEAITRVNEIGFEMGVTPYSTRGFGSSGFAIGDAGREFGASAWLIEVKTGWSHTDDDWNRLENVFFPKNLILFISMCEICESDISASIARADVNNDGIIDILDLTIVSLSYGAFEGEPDYSQEADMTEDGVVDIRDVSTVARYVGRAVP